MKRSAIVLSLMLIVIAFSGCASSLMKPIPKGSESYMPGPEEATIIFMRPYFFGGAIQSSVFDVTTQENKLVGIVSAYKKVAYKTTPGKHMFMVVSESADFMPAEFEGRKTYYALVIPRIGV